MKASPLLLLCCVHTVLLTAQQTSNEEMLIEEVNTEKNITEEHKISMDEEDGDANSILDNFDDVLEAENICSRYSPKEVFHTVVNPHLLKALDEMSTFVDAVLQHVEAALYTLAPHVDQSPTGSLEVDELFLDTRRFMFGTMRDVYDVVRQAWRDLITAQIHNPSLPQHTLTALSHVIEVQSQGEKQLMASLQEFTVMLKAVILNSVHVIQTSLHMPNNTDHEIAAAINRKLPKIAPNFLGTVIFKLLKRGSDTSVFETVPISPLKSIIPLVEKIHAELRAVIDKKVVIGDWKKDEEAEDEEVMDKFWRGAVEASHSHLEGEPLLEEDLKLIYSNEEYLSEVVLELITTF